MSILSISSPEVMAAAIKAGESFAAVSEGVSYEVLSVEKGINIDNEKLKLSVYEVEDDQTVLWISYESNDDIYFLKRIPDFGFDTREKISQTTKDQWIFVTPEDVENFVPSNLEFHDEYEEAGVKYRRISNTLNTYDIKSRMAQLHLFEDVVDESSNVFIILERGMTDATGEVNEEGGYVEIFTGTKLKSNEIEIL